jgi:hypothetical protein
MKPPLNRLWVAGFAALVILVATISFVQWRRPDAPRPARDAVQRALGKKSPAKEQAPAEDQVPQGAAREAQDPQIEADAEAANRAERQRQAAIAQHEQEEQRRAAELERRSLEQQLAREERLATETERKATEHRRAAELAAQREAEQRALRETELQAQLEAEKLAQLDMEKARQAASASAAAAAAEAAAQAPPDRPDWDKNGDDTPDGETETTIDETVAARSWKVSGDLRPIIDGLHEEARNGSTESDIAPGLRARIGAVFGITKYLSLGARVAGTGFVGDFNPEFIRPTTISNFEDLDEGAFTFDQLYLHWKRKEIFDLAVGRIQTRFVLRGGVYAKSLDRNDSHNWRVTWTDGLQATLRTGDWTSNFIVQHNSPDGTGGVRRPPLDFDDSGARYTYFAGFENIKSWHQVVQRGVDISYLPNSMLKDGDPDGRRSDYWGLVGRLMMRWPQRSEGIRLRYGMEVGYAPETPTAYGALLTGAEDVDGLAWNLVASIMDFAPENSIGFEYAQADPGWLLSPQFRPNEELIEIRHMWSPKKFPRIETRIRRRREMDQRAGTARRRTQWDFFIRATWRFTIWDK